MKFFTAYFDRLINFMVIAHCLTTIHLSESLIKILQSSTIDRLSSSLEKSILIKIFFHFLHLNDIILLLIKQRSLLLLLLTTPSYSIGVFEDFVFWGDFLKDFGWIFRSFCEFGGLFVNFDDYMKDFGFFFNLEEY